MIPELITFFCCIFLPYIQSFTRIQIPQSLIRLFVNANCPFANNTRDNSRINFYVDVNWSGTKASAVLSVCLQRQ